MTHLLENERTVEGRDGGADLAVRVRGLTKFFGSGTQRVAALRGVDWDVHTGELSMIVGPSGCGKTTLLSVIAGVLDGDEGEVAVLRLADPGSPTLIQDRDNKNALYVLMPMRV